MSDSGIWRWAAAAGSRGVFLCDFCSFSKKKQLFNAIWITFGISSVAGGGGGKWCYSLPIGLKSMQNSMFLAVFRLILALKREIAPP